MNKADIKPFWLSRIEGKKIVASGQYTVPKGSWSLLSHIAFVYYYTVSIDIMPLGFS